MTFFFDMINEKYYGIFLFLWNNISMNIFLVLNGIRGMFLKSFDLRGEKGTKDIDAGLWKWKAVCCMLRSHLHYHIIITWYGHIAIAEKGIYCVCSNLNNSKNETLMHLHSKCVTLNKLWYWKLR